MPNNSKMCNLEIGFEGIFYGNKTCNIPNWGSCFSNPQSWSELKSQKC